MSFPGFYGTYLPQVRDRFDRVDGPLGPQWTVGDFNPLQIISAMAAQTVNDENGMYWNGQGASDMGCAFTLSVFDPTDYAHYVHLEAPGAAYQYQLYILTSGSDAELYGGGGQIHGAVGLSQTFVQGDRLGCRITRQGSDNRLRLYRQAGAVGSWSPEIYNYLATGAPAGPFFGGIGFYQSATGRVDDFLWDPILGDASDAPRRPRMRSRGTTW